ncbi:uncharacterized protein LOC6546253 [Drosophila erecta]|uniref:Uncharacterized protein n=1 Tax=Drosophila erecta TaxID=7220 RepID=B3ND93_DROER|nr:uncharacterized protein LOC6546253 [Drosophila erecta]XP_026833022.1 uncharacterized protein LOC6546253 [Drosophila erecta]XP_026833023.1 uncharacterized protein LOC6546253 [Drosophila erecta]EDV51886.1 uncharacterized protein Dere_GG13651 [Drosophila erecta]
MRPKDHPDLHFDVIPKLFDAHSKVFLTTLCDVDKQLIHLPRRFCPMYTTRPLATQLFQYLQSRNANVVGQDFHVVEEGQPFALQLKDGKRLEGMLCSGSHLGHSLIVLIRRMQDNRLLYCYSAMRLDNLGRLLGNSVFNSWIAQGTEQLYLNLSSVNLPFDHVDFDEMAHAIEAHGAQNDQSVVHLKVPKFGYEEMVWRLAHTNLRGHIHLGEHMTKCYECLSTDLERFRDENYVPKIFVSGYPTDFNPHQKTVSLDITELKWTPNPTRMHLRQLCSLLRPQHIQGIVQFHTDGIVSPVPSFLKVFKANYSPKSDAVVSTIRSESQAGQAKQGLYRAFRARRAFEFVNDGDESSSSG